MKPKVAAEHGAIACINYSDPGEDGCYVDEPYPVGPMRPEHGVQRGGVMDMPLQPGDPLTPGWGSSEGARRLERADAATIMTIPVMPISYGKTLAGSMAAAVLRMADASVLPFSFSDAALRYGDYVCELFGLATREFGQDSLDVSEMRNAVSALAEA